jgi:rhodanese-related sulfurtransferase
MSDTAVEQQPEHKEEIVATNGDDMAKSAAPQLETNGDTKSDETEAKDSTESAKKESATPKDKISFSMAITLKGIKAKFPSVSQLQTQDLQKWIDEPTANLVLLDVRPEEEYVISHLEGSHRIDPDVTEMEQVLEVVNNLKLEGKETHVVAYCSIGYRSSRLIHRIHQHFKKIAAAEKAEKAASEKAAAEKAAAEKAAAEKEATEKAAAEKTADEKPTEDKAAEDKPAEEKHTEVKPSEAEPTEEKPSDTPKEENDEQKADEKPEELKDEQPAIKYYNLEGSLFKWANEDRPMVDSNNAPVKLVHHYNKIFGKCLRKELRYKPAKEPKKEKDSKKEKTAESNGDAKVENEEKKEAAVNGTEGDATNGAETEKAATVEEPTTAKSDEHAATNGEVATAA